MDGPELPIDVPLATRETDEFWRAVAQGRLLVPRCDSCGGAFWYPRSLCPLCGSFDTRLEESVGTGSIYSFAITHRGPGDYAAVGPYVLAYVELDEGPRILTNIVGVDPADLAIGQWVRVVFERADDDAALYRFTPA